MISRFIYSAKLSSVLLKNVSYWFDKVRGDMMSCVKGREDERKTNCCIKSVIQKKVWYLRFCCITPRAHALRPDWTERWYHPPALRRRFHTERKIQAQKKELAWGKQSWGSPAMHTQHTVSFHTMVDHAACRAMTMLPICLPNCSAILTTRWSHCWDSLQAFYFLLKNWCVKVQRVSFWNWTRAFTIISICFSFETFQLSGLSAISTFKV